MNRTQFCNQPSSQFYQSLFGCSFPFEGWEMENHEKVFLHSVLTSIKSHIYSTQIPADAFLGSLEIGSRTLGSARLIHHISDSLDCIDIDPLLSDRISSAGLDVNFHLGDSSILLPAILDTHETHDPFSFIHVDGDHSREGAFTDVSNSISYGARTKHQLTILVHDIYNPCVYLGVLDALHANTELPFGRSLYVDVTVCPGLLHSKPPVLGELWGGFAVLHFPAAHNDSGIITIESTTQSTLSKLYSLASRSLYPEISECRSRSAQLFHWPY